jgi:hypothetical protein
MAAWGYGLLIVVGTAIVTTGICMRWSRLWSQRLSEHEGYVRGWDACSRVRDRQEAQERKDRLLSRSV